MALASHPVGFESFFMGLAELRVLGGGPIGAWLSALGVRSDGEGIR